ncbi:MAG: hypothetical protein ACOC5L_03620 [Halobacteriota archaeon]
MERKITVALTSHRVEMLDLLEEEARKNQVLILEEPQNEGLYQFLEGKMDAEYYISQIDTTFPVFTGKYLSLLKELYNEDLEIVQIDPYSQHLEEINKAIEEGKLDELSGKGIDVVKRVEKGVTYAWLKYQQEFVDQNFDEIVKGTIFFAQADAQRFRSKDFMRAKHIASFLETSESSNILVETGRMHFLLPEILKKLIEDSYIATVDLVEKKARSCNIQLFENPGNLLTEEYIINKKLGEEEAKLMAAQGLIYISLIEKEELLPTDKNPCPHLKDENKIAEYANGLSYDQCKQEFERIWEFK